MSPVCKILYLIVFAVMFASFRFSASLLLGALLAGGCLPGWQTRAAAQGEAQKLRLHWEPGMLYTQETVTETTTGVTALGMKEDQKMKVSQTTQLEVKETPEKNREVRVTFTSLVGSMRHNGEDFTFDSKDMAKAHPLLKQTLGGSIGKSFVLVYDQEDQFVEARDTGAMADASSGQPALEDLAEAGEVAQLYRRSLEMGLPKASVRPGDQWTSHETVTFPKAGVMNIELRAKFETVTDYGGRPHAKIVFEGEMKRPETEGNGTEKGKTEPAVSSRRVTIGDGSKTYGQILFDLERQTVSASAFRADISLDLGGKKIPVKQLVTTQLISMEKKS